MCISPCVLHWGIHACCLYVGNFSVSEQNIWILTGWVCCTPLHAQPVGACGWARSIFCPPQDGIICPTRSISMYRSAQSTMYFEHLKILSTPRWLRCIRTEGRTYTQTYASTCKRVCAQMHGHACIYMHTCVHALACLSMCIHATIC